MNAAQTANNPEFFPTPKPVIKKMLAPYAKLLCPYEGKPWQILDPSAGAGDILDFLNDGEFRNTRSYYDKGGVKLKHLYAIEQDPELVYTLQGKNYKVIHNDFLQYNGDYLFDLIVMNPPFSNGDEHLLKAWDILHEGHIVCLLNEETILNPYTRRRKLLKSIIDAHGTVEYLGECFADADRPTDCRIAMVRLEKKETATKFKFDFETTDERSFDFSEEIASDDMALNDLTGAMLRQYERTKLAYINYIKAKKELAFYSNGLLDGSVTIGKIADQNYTGNLSESYNGFMDDFKASAWSRIIEKLGMGKFLTNRVMKDFNKFKKTQGAMDLTRENIFGLINMLFENRVNIMDTAVIDVFDIFTKYHKENRCHVEGWKTNDSWKVNQKVILPHYISYGAYTKGYDLKTYGDNFGVNYSYYNECADIDKVMCYLTGKDYNECTTLYDALTNHFKAVGTVRTGDVFNNKGESDFFTFEFFKKGTLHIKFKSTALWQEFNYRACKGKNWLPAEEEKAYRQKKAKEKAQTTKASTTAWPADSQPEPLTNQLLLPNPNNSHEEEQTIENTETDCVVVDSGRDTDSQEHSLPAPAPEEQPGSGTGSDSPQPDPAAESLHQPVNPTAMKKETIVVYNNKKGKAAAGIQAEIKLLKAGSGKWAVGYDITTPLAGSGFSPDPSKASYNTRDQAITAGIGLITQQTTTYSQRSDDPSAPHYKAIHDAVMQYQRQQKQLTLAF